VKKKRQFPCHAHAIPCRSSKKVIRVLVLPQICKPQRKEENTPSPLTEEFDFAQAATGVQVTLLFLPVFKSFLYVVIALNANIRVIAVEVLELDLAGAKRYGCGSLEFGIDSILERLEADICADN
jgi:hypothetical protein